MSKIRRKSVKTIIVILENYWFNLNKIHIKTGKKYGLYLYGKENRTKI